MAARYGVMRASKNRQVRKRKKFVTRTLKLWRRWIKRSLGRHDCLSYNGGVSLTYNRVKCAMDDLVVGVIHHLAV